tara:strand:- start:1477 stop:1725 length:249 start_codon:yes stop_codon:yes gene_type:complete
MRVEHGTYTQAIALSSGVAYDECSKIYVNDVPDETVVEFTLRGATAEDMSSVVSLTVFNGTIIPLVTKKAVWSGSGTLIGLR